MMTRCYQQLLLCALLLATPLTLTAATFSKLVVFGDSLSDNGNLLAIDKQYAFLANSPYQNGFTNGPKAVEQLAKLMNTTLLPSLYFSGQAYGNNFAVAGARAAGNRIIDLNAQVAAFLTSQKGVAPDDTLYVIFIGGNDIRDMRDKTNEREVHTLLDLASRNIKDALLSLADAGANHFLVVNSADIGKLPETSALAKADKHLLKKTSQKTRAYNEILEETTERFQKSRGVHVVLFDLFHFFEGIVNNRKTYHFNNSTDACYSSATFGYYLGCDQQQLDAFVFFDELHPSQKIHERLGRALFAVMPEAN